MATIQLHPADQKKYGTPEIIEIDISAIGVRQRSAVERAAKRTLRWMFDQLEGVPELDEHQNPIPVPKVDPATGEQLVENGEPVFTERLTRDGEAVAMFVWMALWAINIRPAWETFEIRESGLVLRAAEDLEDGDGSGKEQGPEMGSESSTTVQ